MKKTFITIVAILILFGCDHAVDPTNCGIKVDNTESSRDLAVLFIGTSHTHYHDMPELIRQVANSIGDNVYVEMSAPGGYDFERHVNLQATLDALSSRNWDYIVLQESGWRTTLPLEQLRTRVFPFAERLKEIISEKQPNAELILFMTNGYVDGVGTFDSKWCNDEPAVCSYEGMQNRVRETYMKLSEIMDAKIAPAGVVWKSLMSRESEFPILDDDGIHPSLTGSYAHALTIYSVIRRKELNNVFVPAGVAMEDAILIQESVIDMVFHCKPNWRTF